MYILQSTSQVTVLQPFYDLNLTLLIVTTHCKVFLQLLLRVNTSNENDLSTASKVLLENNIQEYRTMRY